MRAAWVGSVPAITLTLIPRLRSTTVAPRPFTLISVNLVIANVLLFFFCRTLRPPAGNASVKFFVRSANVDMKFVVAYFADDVAAEQVATPFASDVSIHETDFAAGIKS